MGRPTDFNEVIATTICERIIEGESLTKICREPEMPCKMSVLRWLDKFPEFSAQYARAREQQQDTLADLAREKAENATNEDWQVARLQIDTIKWHAGKVAPKKYGDRTTLAGDSEAPIEANIAVTFVRPPQI